VGRTRSNFILGRQKNRDLLVAKTPARLAIAGYLGDGGVYCQAFVACVGLTTT